MINSMGSHIQSSGYQSYVNGPYPVTSTRGHQYGNHLQQGETYSGNFSSVHNQYDPSTRHDVCGNHHTPYIENSNNRNFHAKHVWAENNMIVSCNRGLHNQHIVANASSVNMSSMRSPSQVTSNVSPPIQSSVHQHYRLIQTPGHVSPQTWTPGQLAGQGGTHNTVQATPSQQIHNCSPGHSQSFSPCVTHISSSVNIASHSVSSSANENPQPILAAAKVSNEGTVGGPLHSLQKMVMLEENGDSVQLDYELSKDICHQQTIHSSDDVFIAQESHSNDSKDACTTYFDLDKNRLEPNSQSMVAAKSLMLTATTSNEGIISESNESNCLLSNVCQMYNASTCEILKQDFNHEVSSNICDSHPCVKDKNCNPLVQLSGNILSESKVENSVSLSEVDQALYGSTIQKPVVNTSTNIEMDKHLLSIKDSEKSENCSSVSESENSLEASSHTQKKADHLEQECSEKAQIYSEGDVVNDKTECLGEQIGCINSNIINDISLGGGKNSGSRSPSIVKLSAVTDVMVKNQNTFIEVNDSSKNVMGTNKDTVKLEASVVPEVKTETVVLQNEIISKFNSRALSDGDVKDKPLKSETSQNTVTSTCLSNETKVAKSIDPDAKELVSVTNPKIVTSEITRNPVKVVIHRIRTNSSNDTWHVPKLGVETYSEALGKRAVSNCDLKVSANKTVSNIGPQIIILSPAMSRKKFGLTSSNSPKCLDTTQPDDADLKEAKLNINKVTKQQGRKMLHDQKIQIRNSVSETCQNSSLKRPCNASHKKKERPGMSAVRLKTPVVRKKSVKGKRKGVKKRKVDFPEKEHLPKAKKIKPFLGPYVHITGDKQTPVSITVVNVALKEDEAGKKNAKAKNNNIEGVQKRPQVGHTSTLSPHYDAFNTDLTWLCAFCRKGSHCCGLGDLYGPYYIKDHTLNSNHLTQNLGVSIVGSPCPSDVRSNKRISDTYQAECNKFALRKSRLVSTLVESTDSIPLPYEFGSENKQFVEPKFEEIWIHEDCAVWCQGISLMGSRVHGLEDAVHEARQNSCSFCKLFGATLGCWCKGCKEQYHFSCAKEKGCKLDFENFSVLCLQHKNARSFGKRKEGTSI